MANDLLKGKTGIVERVDINSEKVYIEGLKVKKVDGSEVPKSFRTSNLQITELKLDDKLRQAVIERAGKGKVPAEDVKKETKKGKKKGE
jgi:large subunit ribosomal protein L24